MNPSNPSMATVSSGSYEAYQPPQQDALPRAESPPPLPGEPEPAPPRAEAEMDAAAAVPTGRSSRSPGADGQFGRIRDSNADIAGMVGLQQGTSSNLQRHDAYMSDGNKHSDDE